MLARGSKIHALATNLFRPGVLLAWLACSRDADPFYSLPPNPAHSLRDLRISMYSLDRRSPAGEMDQCRDE